MDKNDFYKLEKYSRGYRNFLRNKLSEEKISILKKEIENISDEIIENVEHYVKLDLEYYNNIKYDIILNEPLTYKKSIDTRWRGFWLKATGHDLEKYLYKLSKEFKIFYKC